MDGEIQPGDRLTRPAYTVPAVEAEVVEVQPRMVRVRVLSGGAEGQTWQVPKHEIHDRWGRPVASEPREK